MKRNMQVQSIIQSLPLTLVPYPSACDSHGWLCNSSGAFTTKLTVNLLRDHIAKVDWHHLVWFKHDVPRHSFMFGWFVNIDRLLKIVLFIMDSY